MKKELLTGVIGLFVFASMTYAENEATYNVSTGIIHIPKVIVGSAYYEVEMQQTERANFIVTNVIPTSQSSDSSSSSNAPDGAIWNSETIKYSTAPQRFGAVLGWFQIATMKINHDTSIAATIEIDWERVIEITPDGVRTVVYEENYDSNGQLPATDGGLYLREPNWFPPGDYHEPITDSNVSNGILTINVGATPDRIAHWWTDRVVANENYRYAVEVRARITGELMFQIGSDYWRTLYSPHIDGWDSTCQTSNNCEAWISDWYGDTNNEFITINAPLSY